MRTSNVIHGRLMDLSLRFRLFGRSEIRELRRVLNKFEEIHHCTYGFYQGGSGILVATSERIILLDKRPFYLNIEEIDYENISKVAFSSQIMQATIYLHSGNKQLTFRSVSDGRLRGIKNYVHERTTGVRELEKAFERVAPDSKPYLNPAWRPRNTTILKRTRPTKFYNNSL